ncbi:hypothetical protein GCM10010124_11790 [Pilimelia terevasa]|uniref:Uncharacterized protein n=1 Tax=Pilimelia terevasa TaxID=53372 RepID=A0A8J3BMZ2_9ACTN|nr:hypothetical protein GCM10010124_11790 [Pilimelia terevasa]
MRDGYLARWSGAEYEASPDGSEVRIYRGDAADGFAEISPGRFRRVVPAGEITELTYVRTVCTWREAPFLVLGAHEEWLRVEYTGGLRPVAERLGLEEFDFGVYQGWVPAHEVVDLRESRV